MHVRCAQSDERDREAQPVHAPAGEDDPPAAEVRSLHRLKPASIDPELTESSVSFSGARSACLH